MKKTKWLPLYVQTNTGKKATIPNEKRAGVYLIKNKATGQIVYVGYSETYLYKTMYRHFQEWRENWKRYHFVITGKKVENYLVRVAYCTPGQAKFLEAALIKKYAPQFNNLKYQDEIDFSGQEKKLLELFRSALPAPGNRFEIEEVPF